VAFDFQLRLLWFVAKGAYAPQSEYWCPGDYRLIVYIPIFPGGDFSRFIPKHAKVWGTWVADTPIGWWCLRLMSAALATEAAVFATRWAKKRIVVGVTSGPHLPVSSSVTGIQGGEDGAEAHAMSIVMHSTERGAQPWPPRSRGGGRNMFHVVLLCSLRLFSCSGAKYVNENNVLRGGFEHFVRGIRTFCSGSFEQIVRSFEHFVRLFEHFVRRQPRTTRHEAVINDEFEEY